MTAASWSINRRAADAIARHATSPAECRDLLDMLGVLDDEGRILPDDTAVHVLPDVGKAPSAQNPDAQSPRAFADHGRRPPGMTTPPGLAVLPPLVEPPARGKPLPPHGTRRRFRLHKKVGEDVCQLCRDADNAYSSMRQRAQRAAKKASA